MESILQSKQERREPPSLRSFRGEARRTVTWGKEVVKLAEVFLGEGGPGAIAALRASVKRLTNELKEANESSKVAKYRDLQGQLKESDKVKGALTKLLQDKGVDMKAISDYLKSVVFKEERLYGSTREVLLRENHLLRAQIEERAISEKTSRGPTLRDQENDELMATGGRPSGSRRTKPLAGPQMEMMDSFWKQLELLQAAEGAYQLPVMTSVGCEADDGSLKEIQIMRLQMSTLAGQKTNLLSRVAELQEENTAVGKRLELALDEVAEQRRQKIDLIEHRKDITSEIRRTIEAESKRADTAEAQLAELRVIDHKNVKDLQAAARSLASLETALEEKMNQLDELRGLHKALLLRVGQEQETNGRAILDAVAQQHSALTEAKLAARAAAAQAAELATRQQGLEERTGQAIEALNQERKERWTDSEKAQATFLLSRLKDRQQERTVQILAKDIPAAVSEAMSERIENLQSTVDDVVSRVKLANSQLSYASEATFKRPQRDQADHTSQILLQSRQLRAQLEALSPLDALGVFASASRSRKMNETIGRAFLSSLGGDAGSNGPQITPQAAACVGSTSLGILQHPH